MTMKVRCLLMAISLLMVFFVSGTTSSQSSRTFEGCWTFFAAGQCKAIYRDAQNNLYVADATSVRKITATGAVTTVAGSFGLEGFVNGQGGADRRCLRHGA